MAWNGNQSVTAERKASLRHLEAEYPLAEQSNAPGSAPSSVTDYLEPAFFLGMGHAFIYIIISAARTDGSVVGQEDTGQPYAGTNIEQSPMTIFDLMKATVVCGAIAFLIYSYPILGQIVLIGFLSLLWLLYAHKTIAHLRRK